MKTIRIRSLFILLSALLISSSACAFFPDRIKASGKYITRDLNLSDFDAIELIGSTDILYEQSSNGSYSVQVYGSDNLVDLIEATVSNRTLRVSMKNNVNIHFGKEGKLHVKVSSPEIRSAYLKGSGDIYLTSKIVSPELSLRLEGSGDIKAQSSLATANSFTANLRGSGDIKLEEVQTVSCHINLQGSGDMEAKSLKAVNGQISLQGSGDIDIKENCNIRELEVALVGSGDVKVYGIDSEQVISSLKGSGDVTLKGETQEAILTLSNSGELKAGDLKAQNVNATVQGSGNIECYATNHLRAQANGSATIRYKGKPSVEANGKKENIRPK